MSIYRFISDQPIYESKDGEKTIELGFETYAEMLAGHAARNQRTFYVWHPHKLK